MSETIFPTHRHIIINVNNSPSKSFETFQIQLDTTNRGITCWRARSDSWWAWWPLFLPQALLITLSELSSFIKAAEMFSPIFLKNVFVSFYFFLLTAERPLINILLQVRTDFKVADRKLSLLQHQEWHNWLALSGPQSHDLKANIYSILGN